MARKRRARRQMRRARPGAPPGQLVPDPEAHPSQVRILAYGPDDYGEGDALDHLKKLRGRHKVTWIDVQGLADAAILESLGETFGLHRLAMEDVLNVPQRAKAETYGDVLFVVARMPRSNDPLDTEQISFFVGEDFVITFQERPGDVLDPVRKRIRDGRPRLYGGGPDYLLYALLDAIVDAWFPALEAIADRLDAFEEQIFAGADQRVINELHALKRSLTSLRRWVWPLREVLASLTRDGTTQIRDETRMYFRDCLDHAVQVMELVEVYQENAAGLLDLHLSMVSNRMNEIMKVLTIMATIFIPLSFIAGLYGMNFDPEVSHWNMPELRWRWGYPFALAVMAAVAGGMLFYFRHRGWLGGGGRSRPRESPDAPNPRRSESETDR